MTSKIESDSPLTNIIQLYPDFQYDNTEKNPFTFKSDMYILINGSLNMSHSKITLEVSQVAEKLGEIYKHYPTYNAYVINGYKKVLILIPTEELFIEILTQTQMKEKVYIIDKDEFKNKTTVVGYAPIFDKEVPPILKSLPLYEPQ